MASDDVLTEGELDALMETVDDGATGVDASDDGEYRRFDFGAREHSLLREFTALDSLLERHAELLAKAIEDAFSLEPITRALTPSLLTVADAIAGLEKRVGVTGTKLLPLEGQVFCIAPAALLSYVVNAYFGGRKLSAINSASRSALTPTELRTAERIAELQLECLCSAWADKIPLEVGDLLTLGAPDRLELLPINDLMLRLQFVVAAGEEEFQLDILLPFASLEPYREKFLPPRKDDEIAEADSWEPFFRRELPAIELEVSGVLTTRPIALAELLELSAGAVIPMAPPESVTLKSDGVTLAEGRYGTHDGEKAMQVERLASLLGHPAN